MSIILRRGKHQHNVPRGTEELFEEVLVRAGFSMDDEWVVNFGPRVKGTPTMPRFRVKGASDSWKSVEVRIKPGGNDTSNICWIFPPKGRTTDELERRLRALQEPSAVGPDENKEHEQIADPQNERAGAGMNKDASSQSASPLNGFTRNKEYVDIFLYATSEITEQPTPISLIRETIRHVFDIKDVSDRSIGKVLGTLEHQGLILTTRDSTKRILTVILTDAGRERIKTHVRASARLKKVTDVEIPPPPAPLDRISAATEQLAQEAAELEKKLHEEEEKASLTRRALEKIQAALNALRG